MVKYVYLAVAVVFLGLCGWTWYQSQMIDDLKAENRTQAQTIAEQQKANERLNATLEVERQAVEAAQKNAKALQHKVEIAQREIKSILAKDQCATMALPDGVADHIKRLHQQATNRKH